MKRFALFLAVLVPFSAGAADLSQTTPFAQKRFFASPSGALAVSSYRIPAPTGLYGHLAAFDFGYAARTAAGSDFSATAYGSRDVLQLNLPLGFDNGNSPATSRPDQFGAHPQGAESRSSAGPGPLTPYAGIGKVPLRTALDDLSIVKPDEPSRRDYYIGARFNFALFNLAIESDRTDDTPTYALNLNWRF